MKSATAAAGAAPSAPPDRGYSQFPHYRSRYKCCCNAVHVKQGTLMIGVVNAAFTLIGLFSTAFSSDNIYTAIFEGVYLLAEAVCLVFLFVAVFKDKKVFLIPFILNQIISAFICAIFAIVCIWALFDTESFIGSVIKCMYSPLGIGRNLCNSIRLQRFRPILDCTSPNGECALLSETQLESVTSVEEIEIEKEHPEIAGEMIIRLTASFLAIASVLFLCLTLWWLVVIYRCYVYYSDMEKYTDPQLPPVSYNPHQGVKLYQN